MNLLKKLLVLPIVAGATFSMADQATFDDFGTGSTFDNSTGWNVHDPIANEIFPAFRFQATTSGTLSGVDVAVGNLAGLDDNAFQVYLWSAGTDAAVGATQLWVGNSSTGGVLATNLTVPESLSGNGVTINAGDYYWLQIETTSTTFSLTWDQNSTNTSTSGLYDGIHSTSTGALDGAFRVRVNPPGATPEPFTMGIGAAGILLATRRKLASRKK